MLYICYDDLQKLICFGREKVVHAKKEGRGNKGERR
jgi:hypothetical protein